jgi:hypothetical protein
MGQGREQGKGTVMGTKTVKGKGLGEGQERQGHGQDRDTYPFKYEKRMHIR